MGPGYGSAGPECGVRGLALGALAFAALGSPPAAAACAESAGATTGPSTSLTGTPIPRTACG